MMSSNTSDILPTLAMLPLKISGDIARIVGGVVAVESSTAHGSGGSGMALDGCQTSLP
jgi:hypothetical protein